MKIRVGMHAKSDSPRSAKAVPDHLPGMDGRLGYPNESIWVVGYKSNGRPGTWQNRRKDAQEASALIGGLKPGVELEVHLRGNPIFVGANCHIVLFDEGGVLHGRGEAPACGRRPDSFRR